MSLLFRARIARAVALVSLAYLACYLYWRITGTLNPAAPLFSAVFLAAEVYGAFNLILFVGMTWDIDRRAPFSLQSDCSVDVFVPTFDEGLELLEATLVGCSLICYPHTTYVLDDGRRPEVAALARRLGCCYLTRPTNAHAKAGNLNAALARTRGEFVVVLDADTVPQPELLDRTLGYFVDPKVALVQLPQEFYNVDSFQHERDSLSAVPWHEQGLFYRVIQPGKNRWNAAFWCGSPSVVRRAALESIGGVATETVTEDIHTSLRLHAAGWRTVYHHEVLAYGIAPQSLAAYTVQRLRWAQGSMQLLRTRENPLIMPGLSVAQRLNYLASMLPYFDPFQKLVFLGTPALILVTGAMPLRVGGLTYLLHWIPFIVLTTLTNVALGRGWFNYLAVETHNYLKLFTFLRASPQLLRSARLRFRVTPKSLSGQDRLLDRRLLLPILALIVAEVGAGLLGTLSLLGVVARHYSEPRLAMMAIAWLLVNVALLGNGVAVVARHRYRRRAYRFPLALSAALDRGDGRPVGATVHDLSLLGARVTSTAPVAVNDAFQLVVSLPDGPLAVDGTVVNARVLGNDQTQIGATFNLANSTDRARLLAFLFVSAPPMQRRERVVHGSPTAIGSADSAPSNALSVR